MGGGLMQLVAYGAQDIYLTGNPQITFFKVVYRRHTNFAVESIEQTFNGQADFGKRVTATISRNGDLIQQMYLEVITPVMGTNNQTWTYGFGNALIKQAEIEIGGQLIDRQYGDWMNIWTELTVPAGKRDGYDNMVGNKAGWIAQKGLVDAEEAQRFYVPLQFWFNRNPGLALPLIALQYHEVKLNLEIRPAAELLNSSTSTVTNGLLCKLYVDYIYLDTDERRRFAQVSHEYLIEQVQFTGSESIATASPTKNITLNFNHPVKELVWVHLRTDFATVDPVDGNRWFNYSGKTLDNESGGCDSFTTALLQLNGHDRFSVRGADYFRKVQNYEHHTRVPRVRNDLWQDGDKNFRQYIYSYSFALSPEEHQPSGTCNFSRIDNAILQLTYGKDALALVGGSNAQTQAMNLNIYAVNYNVLRIMSGMGGLAYSN
uniref:Major capsid protein N-terminal domain-containing protein n=1 Tax=viral metagenome TaxID=1070528 RepID=A0A6C0EYT5_9ZZZZ